jgi:hypothetical protein
MTLVCKYCGRNYTKHNVTRHRKSKICKSYQDAVNAFNKILLDDDRKITTLKDLVKVPFTNESGKTIYINPLQLKFINKLKN